MRDVAGIRRAVERRVRRDGDGSPQSSLGGLAAVSDVLSRHVHHRVVGDGVAQRMHHPEMGDPRVQRRVGCEQRCTEPVGSVRPRVRADVAVRQIVVRRRARARSARDRQQREWREQEEATHGWLRFLRPARADGPARSRPEHARSGVDLRRAVRRCGRPARCPGETVRPRSEALDLADPMATRLDLPPCLQRHQRRHVRTKRRP